MSGLARGNVIDDRASGAPADTRGHAGFVMILLIRSHAQRYLAVARLTVEGTFPGPLPLANQLRFEQ